MRLKVRFSSKLPVRLTFGYQQILQGLIYTTLQDREFSQFLHESGFTVGNRSFKLFTFSRLEGNYTIDHKAKEIVFYDEFIWRISSVIPQFIQDLGQSLLTSNVLHLNGQAIHVEELSYSTPTISQDTCLINMLSPITIHSTYENEDGQKITQYFDPEDAVFSHLIKENIKKKYEAFCGERHKGEFIIRPVKVNAKDKVVTRFKGFVISGWHGQYELRGSSELIDFAYKVGIGSRSSQGFGMFDVV